MGRSLSNLESGSLITFKNLLSCISEDQRYSNPNETTNDHSREHCNASGLMKMNEGGRLCLISMTLYCIEIMFISQFYREFISDLWRTIFTDNSF